MRSFRKTFTRQVGNFFLVYVFNGYQTSKWNKTVLTVVVHVGSYSHLPDYHRSDGRSLRIVHKQTEVFMLFSCHSHLLVALSHISTFPIAQPLDKA